MLSGNVHWLGGPLKIDVGATNQVSAVLDSEKAVLISPVGCYFQIGKTPVATTDPAASFYLPPDTYIMIAVPKDAKIACIQKDTAGWLQIIKVF